MDKSGIKKGTNTAKFNAPKGELDVAMTNVINTVADGSVTRAKLNFDLDDEAAALAIALG